MEPPISNGLLVWFNNRGMKKVGMGSPRKKYFYEFEDRNYNSLHLFEYKLQCLSGALLMIVTSEHLWSFHIEVRLFFDSYGELELSCEISCRKSRFKVNILIFKRTHGNSLKFKGRSPEVVRFLIIGGLQREFGFPVAWDILEIIQNLSFKLQRWHRKTLPILKNTVLEFISWISLKAARHLSVQFSRSVVSNALRPHGLQHARLPITNSQSLLKFMSLESVMPYNHLILCCPLFFPPSIFPSIRVFSSESALRMRWPKYWSFSFSISPSNGYSGLTSFSMGWLDLLAVRGTQDSSPTPQFNSINF